MGSFEGGWPLEGGDLRSHAQERACACMRVDPWASVTCSGREGGQGSAEDGIEWRASAMGDSGCEPPGDTSGRSSGASIWHLVALAWLLAGRGNPAMLLQRKPEGYVWGVLCAPCTHECRRSKWPRGGRVCVWVLGFGRRKEKARV